MLRKLTLVVMLIVFILPAASLWAQEELSEEEVALLQRYFDSSEAVRAYDSYIDVQINSQVQVLEVVSDGVVVQAQESSNFEQSTTTVIHGDDPSGLREITQIDDDGTSIIEANVELRYVDGAVYASGSYVDGDGPIAFPDGYVKVDPADAGEFTDFDVEDFVRVVMAEPDVDNPLSNFDTLLSLVDSVSSGEGDLDGEMVEVITVTIPAANLFDLLLQIDPEGFGNPQIAALFSAISDDSLAIVHLYLDAEGLPLAREVMMTVNITEIPLSEFDPNQPEGPTVNFILTLEQTSTLTQINESLPAVSVP